MPRFEDAFPLIPDKQGSGISFEDAFPPIPDKQKEIDSLKEALAHKTKLCDSMEGKVAYKTRIINQLDARIAQLEQANLDHITERQAWITEKADLMQQLETKRNMYNIMDNLKHIAGLLSTTLDEERACKRARKSDEP